jgi:transposase
VARRRLTVVLDPHRWLELRRFRPLYESGAMSLREIAKETGLNRRTVSKYLKDPASAAPPKREPGVQRPRRVVDEVAPLIDAMLRAEILLKGAVIHERLVQEYGVTINYQRVKLYLQEARPRIAEELGISPGELGVCTGGSRSSPVLRPRWTGAMRARSSLMSGFRRSTRST